MYVPTERADKLIRIFPSLLYISIEGRWMMMAEAVLSQTRLRLLFETGMDDTGKPTFKTKTFNNIKKTANANELHSTATALAGLSNYILDSVERNDSYDIVE